MTCAPTDAEGLSLAIVTDRHKADANKLAVDPVVNEILLMANAKAVEKITTYRYWPLFLPDAQTIAIEVYHELDFMLRRVVVNEFSVAFRKLSVQVDDQELAEFISEKKARRRGGTPCDEETQTMPPSPTSPADANAPPFAEDMA